MRHLNDVLRLLSLVSATASLLLASAVASVAQAQPVGSPGWLSSAQQAAAPLVQPTPSLPQAPGPRTTPPFETINGALVASGSQTETVIDLQTRGLLPLRLVRTYNGATSGAGADSLFSGWRTNLDAHLVFYPADTGFPADVIAYRSDGSQVYYKGDGYGNYQNTSPDAKSRIVRSSDGATYTMLFNDGSAETYDSYGYVRSIKDPTGVGLSFGYINPYSDNEQLQTVTASDGRSIILGWSGGQVIWVQDPAGNRIQYGYDPTTPSRLTSVTYPNGDQITYSYTAGQLSGIDVNGTRYRSFSYTNSSNGPVVQQSGYGANQGVERATFSYGANTTTVTSATGASTTYTYQTIQGQPKLTQVKTTGVNGSSAAIVTLSYDANGHPISMVDPRGITTRYSYSGDGLLLDKITGIDPNHPGQQRETVYTWDTVKDRISEIKRYGNSQSDPISDTVYSYYPDSSPAKNRIQSIVITNLTANGVANQTQTTTYSYQFYANGMPSLITIDGPLAGASGHVEQHFDSQGNLTSAVDGLGLTTSYSGYNGLGLPGSVTDASGYTVNLAYDGRGRVTSVSRPVNGTAATTTYAYDGLGHVIQIGYPDGGWVQYTYDDAGRLTELKTDTGGDETFNYDSLRDVTFQAWPGFSHMRGYDSLGRPAADQGNNGQDVQYAYDADGNLAKITDSLGNVWTYSYNAHNQVQTSTDPNGKVTALAYDGAGHLASATDPDGHITRYQWDGFGQLVQQNSPDSGITTYAYDARGRLVQMTRADGITTSLQYDADNRPTRIAAGGLIETFTYDACANGKTRLCGFTDPSGSTAYSYTPDGQLASQTQVIGGVSYTTRWSYDSRDRVVAISYPGGNRVQYSYNTQSLVIGVNAVVGGVADTVADSFSYQGAGLGPITGLRQGDGSTTAWSYDLDDRLTNLAGGSVENHHYGFDADDRITSIADNTDSNLNETLNYDALNRLVGVASQGLGDQVLTYDANGNRSSHTASGTSQTYNLWPGSNRVANIAGAHPRAFRYDADGNVTAITGSHADACQSSDPRAGGDNKAENPCTVYGYKGVNGCPTPVDSTEFFANGPINWPSASSVGASGGGNCHDSTACTYNWGASNLSADHNVLGVTYHYRPTLTTYCGGGGGGGGGGSPPPPCKLCSYNGVTTLGSLDTATGTAAFAPASESSPVSLGGISFAYDAFNHLSGVTTGAGTTGYLYNALGQRVRKTGAAGNISYVYAPDGSLLGETANGGSTLATEYVWLPSAGNGPPQLLGVIRNTTLYYVHDDHLGRPQVVTTASGSIVWQAANAAFDRTVTTDTFGGLNLGFPGQYYDAESGLYYNGFRYYDPTSGRYLQPDPLGLIGGANPFVYALNDPISLIDLLGLDCGQSRPGTTNQTGGLLGGTLGVYIGAVLGGSFGYSITAGGGIEGITGVLEVVHTVGALGLTGAIGFGAAGFLIGTGFAALGYGIYRLTLPSPNQANSNASGSGCKNPTPRNKQTTPGPNNSGSGFGGSGEGIDRGGYSGGLAGTAFDAPEVCSTVTYIQGDAIIVTVNCR